MQYLHYEHAFNNQNICQKRSLNETVSYLCSWLVKIWLLPFVNFPWLLWWKWNNCFWWYNYRNIIRLSCVTKHTLH